MTPAIWLFDSDCVLCEGGVHYTLKHEKAPSIHFISIQSQQGRALAIEHGVDPDDPTTFLFIENGIAHQKSDGVFALARHLNGPARIVLAGVIIPKPIRDFLYGLVAKYRYRVFGRTKMCIMPDPQNKHRFTS